MRILILIIFFVSLNVRAITSFEPGSVISKEVINANLLEINNYLKIYGIEEYFNLVNSQNISSSELNSNIEKLNQSFSLSLPLLNQRSNVSASVLNSYFNQLIDGSLNNLFFNSCSNRKDNNSGFYLIDYDGFEGNAPVKEFCNYLDGISNINKFKITAHSRGFNNSSLSISSVNGRSFSFGRGTGVVVYDEDLNFIYSSGYDNYEYASEGNRLNSDLLLLNKFPNKSLIVVTVGDSAERNLNFASRLNSMYGCNMSGLAHRTGYICISYKKANGQFIKLYENRGGNISTTQYVDYTDFYDYLK